MVRRLVLLALLASACDREAAGVPLPAYTAPPPPTPTPTGPPAYAGVAMPEGGYSVFRIESVTRPELAKDDPRLQAVSQQYQRLIAERDFNAFLASLRERYEVEINEAALRAAQQP